MILTDIDIRDRILNYQKYNLNNPMIENFNEEKLQGASYDISIINMIHIYKNITKTVDIGNQNKVDDIYECIDITNGYEIKPNQYILVTLNERINLPSDLVAHLRPRTTFTRLGLVLTAQHCNPTYCGVLQLGIYNAAPFKIKIYPSIKVGQIVFERLNNIPSENKWYENKPDAKYNNESAFIGSKFYGELSNDEMREVDNKVSSLISRLKGRKVGEQNE